MKRWLYKRPKVIRAASLFESTWQAGIKNVGAYFSVKNTKAEMEAWSPRISVSSRGYMLGYQKLDDPAVRPIHRLLAKIADGPMRLQIVRVDFRGTVWWIFEEPYRLRSVQGRWNCPAGQMKYLL